MGNTMLPPASARETVLILVALIVAFAAFLTAFRLVARAREASLEGRAGWTFLAGIAGGSGIWSSHALLTLALHDGIAFEAGLLLGSYFLSVAACLAALTLHASLDRGVGSLMAGATLTAAAAFADLLELRAIATDQAVIWNGGLTGLAGAAVAVLFSAAFAVASRPAERTGDVAIAAAALLAALAVPLTNSLFLGAAGFEAIPNFWHGPDVAGGPAVAATVAGAMFLAIGSGMAIALIDRDGQYASQRRLRQFQEASVEGLVIVRSNKVVDVNDSFLRISGLTREEVRGQPFVGTLLQAEFGDEDLPPSVLWEGQIAAAGGRLVPVEIVARPFDYDGGPHTVFAVRDLSDRLDAELRIRFLAEHDVLTGLPNRASFQRRLETACREVRTDGRRFALFCLDLDRFKEANDVFGHLAGDAVLAQTATRLRALLGPDAFASRLGGDEFVVLVFDPSGTRAVADIADEIVTNLSRPFLYNGQRIHAGTSVGIAVAPNDGEAPELLLARADMALYRAKGQGRGRYCFFERSMDEETRLRRTLAFQLRDAIAADELEIHYQPLANLSAQAIIGFEALARWRHPVHGMIAPGVFISIAEESGAIAELGEWVLRTACAEAARWRNPLKVAVNLSALQLEQVNLPEIVHGILYSTGLSPGRLELEVTESSLMRNPQRALDVLRRIKSLGVDIAMDDFGTGFSSLSTLQSFPFDKLKIDRSFVDRVGVQDQASSIVRAVVGLSRSLDIRVVAEGVENTAQIEFLTGEACDEVQGFAIGRPLPIADYAHVIGDPSAIEREADLRFAT